MRIRLRLVRRSVACTAALGLALLAGCGEAGSDDAPAQVAPTSGDVGATLLEQPAQPLPGEEQEVVTQLASFEALYVHGPPPLITDCETGIAYRPQATPMADSLIAIYPRLNRQGDPVGVAIEGLLFAAPDGTPTVRIDAFHSLTPRSECGQGEVDRPLDGTVWELLSVLGNPVAESVDATLTFDREGEAVRGSTGCNTFSGAYEVVGTLLSLGSVGLTRLACPSEATALEADVLEAFRVAGSFRIVGDELHLLGEAGPVAVYRAR